MKNEKNQKLGALQESGVSNGAVEVSMKLDLGHWMYPFHFFFPSRREEKRVTQCRDKTFL